MKKRKKIVTYCEQETNNLAGKTDFARLEAMQDEDIDFSDIPLLTDEFWKNANIIRRSATLPII